MLMFISATVARVDLIDKGGIITMKLIRTDSYDGAYALVSHSAFESVCGEVDHRLHASVRSQE